MKKGTQIAYIPPHAKGIEHPDVEFGFVVKDTGKGSHYCRYWRKDMLGELRTKNNSELTFDDRLVEHKSVSDSLVEKTMWYYCI